MPLLSTSERPGPLLGIQQLLKVLLISSLAAPALVLAIYGVLSYSDTFHQAELRAEHLSRLLQEHALKVFETVGLVLQETDQRLRSIDADTIRSSRALWEELRELERASEQVDSIFVLDAKGKLLLTTRTFPPGEVDFSDRDYFIAHKSGNAALFLGRAYIGRISDAPIFNFSIPRMSSDGSFAGVIGSSAFVGYFQEFYKTVGEPADNFAVLLVREDGNVLVRHPATAIGMKFDAWETSVPSLAEGAGGVFYRPSPLDGIERLYAVTKLRKFPAFVMYSIDRASIVRAWYARMVVSTALAALFAGGLFLITAFALRRARTEALAVDQVRRTSLSLQEEIDRRERAEASLLQSQRLDAVGRLTGGIAHDFNNLLQIILGNLEIALRRPDPAKLKRAVTSAQYAAQRGADLTRGLLAFSRQQALRPEIVDVNAVVDKARSLLGRTLSDEIELDFQYADGLWPVRVDVAQFEAALLNLVVNARDAMPQGGKLSFLTQNVVLDEDEVSARHLQLTPGEYVAVLVSDTGSGMSPEVLARVFEPFFTTKEVGKGSGLGLSQVYGFAGQSGGGVSIESEMAVGTTVCLYLPKSATPLEEKPTLKDGTSQRGTSGGIVLIVEDNDEVRRVLAGALDDLGYTTLAARNGPEALALISAGEPIDILLSDVFMPRGLSGVQLAEKALALRPRLRVLLTTASLDVDARFPLLRKPYSRDELGRRLAQLSGTLAD